MNLIQFLKHVTEMEETIRERLQRLYDVYNAQDSSPVERHEFICEWIENAGPMLAGLNAAEKKLDQVGELVYAAGVVETGDSVSEALERLIRQRNEAREAEGVAYKTGLDDGREQAFHELRVLVGV